jgi:hypothetical protein
VKIRPEPQGWDWIWITVCVVLILIILFWSLMGCTQQKGDLYEATYSSGCYFHITAIEVENAEQIVGDWDLKDCEVKHDLKLDGINIKEIQE